MITISIEAVELEYVKTEYDFSRICDFYNIVSSKDKIIDSPYISNRIIVNGKVVSDNWYYKDEIKYTTEIEHYKTVCVNTTKEIEDNKTRELKNKTIEICNKEIDYIEIINNERIEWNKKNSYLVKKDEVKQIKYCGIVEREYIKDRGWVIEIDNIPFFENKEYKEYVWWNSTYPFRWHIDNSANTLDYYAYSINDTYGLKNSFFRGNISNDSYVYSIDINMSKIAIATNTTENNWYNTSDCSGFNENNVFNGVGIWHYDANAGSSVLDCSGNNNIATCKNMRGGSGTTNCNWTNGVFGYGIDFDGTNDYMDCGNDASLNSFSLISFVTWIKIASGYTCTDNGIIGKGDGVTGFLIYCNNNKISFYINNVHSDTSLALNMDEWYLISGSWSGTQIKLYINGELNDTDNQNTFTDMATNLYLGTYSTDNNIPRTQSSFNGSIDETCIFDRLVSQNEFRELYQNGINNRTSLGINETYTTTTTIYLSENITYRYIYVSSDKPIQERLGISNDMIYTSLITSLMVIILIMVFMNLR